MHVYMYVQLCEGMCVFFSQIHQLMFYWGSTSIYVRVVTFFKVKHKYNKFNYHSIVSLLQN